MAHGPGKYDDFVTHVREQAQAEAVLLIVFNGNRGSGFSMQARGHMPPAQVAAILEDTARQIRASGQGQ